MTLVNSLTGVFDILSTWWMSIVQSLFPQIYLYDYLLKSYEVFANCHIANFKTENFEWLSCKIR